MKMFLLAGLAFALPFLASPAERLTLDQAWALAESLHPALAEGQALREGAEARARQAGAFPNPEGIARVESAPSSEYLAGFAQTIPLGGRLQKAREAAELERNVRAQALETRRAQIKQRIHSAFATALYQERAFQIQHDLTAALEQAAGAARVRVAAGDALPAEAARAEMELARARAEAARTGALRKQAAAALAAAIGDPGLAIASLEGDLSATFEVPAIESLARNVGMHPAARLADAEVRERLARAELAKAERIPDVRLELLYRRRPEDRRDTFDAGVIIPIPLFDRGQGRLREARAEAAAAEARSRSAQNELTHAAQEAHARIEAALSAASALRTEILPRADLILEGAEARRREGDISLSDLLPVRRDWAAAQLAYLESIHDVMQAWAALRPFLDLR